MSILAHEPAIRLGAFAVVLIAMMAWEAWVPRRSRVFPRARRWPWNLLLVAIDTAAVRLLVPITAVQAAIFARDQGMGVLHWVDWPSWASALVAIIVLDLVVYLQHVMFHAVPLLWRFHHIHHADRDIDVTTGIRFHPIEILISMGIKGVTVLWLGPPIAALILFEVILNATAMFNHANVRIPLGTDRWLRWIVVTPDMHRVHHSVHREETDSNFGFNFPYWDRIFGTYRDQPREGHEGMTIGLPHLQIPDVTRLSWILIAPFRGIPAFIFRQEREAKP